MNKQSGIIHAQYSLKTHRDTNKAWEAMPFPCFQVKRQRSPKAPRSVNRGGFQGEKGSNNEAHWKESSSCSAGRFPCLIQSYQKKQRNGIDKLFLNMHKKIHLAPKSRQAGDDLLFSAHDLREKDLIIFRSHTKRLADYIIITNIQKLTALQQNIRQHQNHQ